MYHFIFPVKKSYWSVDEVSFTVKLLQKWPQAVLEKPTNPEASYLLTWDTLSENKGIYGSLSQDRKRIRLDGHFQESAEFAVWFQQQYPEQEMMLADESANFYIRLPGKTVKDVLTAMTTDGFEGDDPVLG